MDTTAFTTPYIYPRGVWLLYTFLGLLPWSQDVNRRGRIRPGPLMLGYVSLLLTIFNVFFFYCFFYTDYLVKPDSRRLNRISKVIGQLRSCFLAVTYNVILLSTCIQTYRKKLDEIIHNLKDFDMRYNGEPAIVRTKITRWWFKVITVLTIIDLERSGTDMHENNVVSRICVVCILQLFSVIATNINCRYRKLNEKLLKHPYSKKPFIIKFSSQGCEYLYNEDLSMLRDTRFLHKLLGNTVKLTNSLCGAQLFCCFIVCIQEASFLPWYFLFSFEKYFDKFDWRTVMSLVTGTPGILFLFVQIICTVYDAHLTIKEAQRTTKTVHLILNTHDLLRPWEKELKSLSLQLPLQVKKFTVLGLFELKPPLLQNLLSLFSAYCLILIQLHGS